MIMAVPGSHHVFILLIEKSPKRKTAWADSHQEWCKMMIFNDKNVKISFNVCKGQTGNGRKFQIKFPTSDPAEG